MIRKLNLTIVDLRVWQMLKTIISYLILLLCTSFGTAVAFADGDVWLGKWHGKSIYKETTQVWEWWFEVKKNGEGYQIQTHTEGPDTVEILNISSNQLEFLFHDALQTHIRISRTGNAFSGTVDQPKNSGLPHGRVEGRRGITISIESATYGLNCDQPIGNVTSHIAQSCNGKSDCKYFVDHTVIGDPAFGCKKNYIVRYRCSDSSSVFEKTLVEEAGWGDKFVLLDCNDDQELDVGKSLSSTNPIEKIRFVSSDPKYVEIGQSIRVEVTLKEVPQPGSVPVSIHLRNSTAVETVKVIADVPTSDPRIFNTQPIRIVAPEDSNDRAIQ